MNEQGCREGGGAQRDSLPLAADVDGVPDAELK